MKGRRLQRERSLWKAFRWRKLVNEPISVEELKCSLNRLETNARTFLSTSKGTNLGVNSLMLWRWVG